MSTSQIVEVPLSAHDKKHIQAYSTGFVGEWVGNALWISGLVAGVIYVVTRNIWAWLIPVGHPDDYSWWILLTAVAIGAWASRSIWVLAYKALRPSRDAETPFERDLAGGVAKVLTADVLRVVEIEEYEDEGEGFLLELGDGRVLAVVSQNFYEFTHDFEIEESEEDNRDAFPQTRIEYRYAPHSGLHLGIRGVGEPLRPLGLVKTDSHHFVRSGRKGPRRFIGAEDGAFYDGTLEEVLARLKYTLKPMPAAQ
ncbi:MAG: hypothetical protein C0471_04600 [Erythrobacter sp.]|nr:hypothetical protein [Erythrobacter sp.]